MIALSHRKLGTKRLWVVLSHIESQEQKGLSRLPEHRKLGTKRLLVKDGTSKVRNKKAKVVSQKHRKLGTKRLGTACSGHRKLGTKRHQGQADAIESQEQEGDERVATTSKVRNKKARSLSQGIESQEQKGAGGKKPHRKLGTKRQAAEKISSKVRNKKA